MLIVILSGVTPAASYALKGLFYEIKEPELGYSLSYEFDNEERTGATREDDNVSETFTEQMDIKTGGWLIYDRLMTYSLRLSPEWEQMRQYTDDDLENKSRNATLAYYASATFLPKKPYTLDVFGSKSTSTFTTTFAEKSRAVSDSYGATLSLKYDILPTTAKYRHEESTQTGFFSSQKEFDRVNLIIRHDKFLGESELTASYSDGSTSFRDVKTETETKNTAFRNNYAFNKSARLTSRYSYNESTAGGFSTGRSNFHEALDWEPNDNMRTHSSFRYSNTEFETFRSESAELGFNLNTLLYEKVATSLFLTGSSSRAAGLKEHDYGAGVGLKYSKEISLGKLGLSTRHSYSINDRDAESEFNDVKDESVTLTSGPGTELIRTNVVSNSLEVTDATGAIEYKKDVHFSVREVGNSTIISRISIVPITESIPPIANDETVLVDYIYQTNATYDSSTFSESYKADLYLWSALRLAYSYSHTSQEILSGIAPDEPVDDATHLASAELLWKWSKTTAEYEYRDITNLPSESVRVGQSISFSPLSSIFFSLSGGYGITNFIDTDETNRVYKANSSLQWFPSRILNCSFEGFFIEQDGDIIKTREKGITSLLRYSLGILQLSAEYRFGNSIDLVSNEERTNNYFLFKVVKNSS